jgi:hypothetical protein
LTDREEESMSISLPVRKSAISSVESGLARINISHMDMFGDLEHPMAVLTNEKKRVVVKIVADRLAPANCITLRARDMDDLEVEEGDQVTLEPYSKLTSELKESWKKFIKRFKKKDEEEEGDD